MEENTTLRKTIGEANWDLMKVSESYLSGEISSLITLTSSPVEPNQSGSSTSPKLPDPANSSLQPKRHRTRFPKPKRRSAKRLRVNKSVDADAENPAAEAEKRIQCELTAVLRDFYRERRGPGTPYYQHAHVRFTKFSKLPIELRLKIWQMSFPGPRFLEVAWERTKAKPPDEMIFRRSSKKAPVALFTCQESRREALKTYQALQNASKRKLSIEFFNFSVDTLYFSPRTLFSSGTALVDALPTHATKIQYLAMKPIWFCHWGHIDEAFPLLCDLKELMIALPTKSADGEVIVGFEDLTEEQWIADARQFPPMFEYALKKIQGTFERIQLKHPAWKAPNVRAGSIHLCGLF